MKKLIFGLVLAIMAVFSSCTGNKSENGNNSVLKMNDVVVNVKNATDVIKVDFNTVESVTPGSMFYESQIVFDTILTVDNANTIGIKSIMNVIQAGRQCHQFYHSVIEGKGRNEEIVVNDWWLEDVVIDLSKIITLDEAITKLNQSNVVKPKSNRCTLRCPLGPKVENPKYIFGTISTGFVYVDAITGEVGIQN